MSPVDLCPVCWTRLMGVRRRAELTRMEATILEATATFDARALPVEACANGFSDAAGLDPPFRCALAAVRWIRSRVPQRNCTL